MKYRPPPNLLRLLRIARIGAAMSRALGEPFRPEDVLDPHDVDSLGPDWLKATTEDLMPDLPGTEGSRWMHSQAGESEEQ